MPELHQRDPHIDGLRSLAIIPVVLFHAGWSALPGGFVGVDIFFVISGYLITRILYREIADNEFSLLRFYERRARRIMPAFFVIVAVCTVIAMLILLPQDLVLYARSLFFAMIFASNFYFYNNSDYFDVPAESYAMLHTWSLAVEEQFYLLFPIILYLAAKLPRTWTILVVAAIAAGSFVYSGLISADEPVFAFYLPLTRTWELLAGSLLALGLVPQIEWRTLRELSAALCLSAVVWSVFFLSGDWAFPGWIAAVPVLGAAGLIHYAPGTWVGRLLSLRPLVWVGLVSYSLYLWHWPLLSFAAYWLIRPLEVWEGTALVGLALGLSVLTFWLVERPFRGRSFLTRKVVFAATLSGMGIVSCICGAAVFSNGLPIRVPGEVQRLASFATDRSPEYQRCHDRTRRRSPDKACNLGADVPASIAVWGDSHGIELSYALGEAAARSGKSVRELTASACPPSLNYTPNNARYCAANNERVLNYLLEHSEITTVIFVAMRGSDNSDVVNTVFAGTEEAVRRLVDAGRQVVVTYPTPRPGTGRDVPTTLARELWFRGQADPILQSRDAYRADFANTISALDALVEKYKLTAIDSSSVFCPGEDCLLLRDGAVMIIDTHHPSLTAQRMVAPLYAGVIAAAGR